MKKSTSTRTVLKIKDVPVFSYKYYARQYETVIPSLTVIFERS